MVGNKIRFLSLICPKAVLLAKSKCSRGLSANWKRLKDRSSGPASWPERVCESVYTMFFCWCSVCPVQASSCKGSLHKDLPHQPLSCRYAPVATHTRDGLLHGGSDEMQRNSLKRAPPILRPDRDQSALSVGTVHKVSGKILFPFPPLPSLLSHLFSSSLPTDCQRRHIRHKDAIDGRSTASSAQCNENSGPCASPRERTGGKINGRTPADRRGLRPHGRCSGLLGKENVE